MQIPTHPRLGVGVRVLRHGADQWQVGLEPEHRLRLPDTPEVRRTLSGLREAAPAAQSDAVVLSALAAHGLLHHDETPAAVGRVVVRCFGVGEIPDPSVPLAQAGLTPVVDTDEPDEGPAAALLVGFGEPVRALTDRWLLHGLPHLVVRLRADEALVGPLVVPGDGACLRCLDAHRTEDDPRWPQLVHRQAELDATPRRDGLGERADPVLAALALAWAARDLTSHLAGRAVSTRSATLRVPRDLGDLELVSWHQHPDCSCTW